jgi:hypothetical protein
MCCGGSGVRISMCCTRTRWAMVCFGFIFHFLFQAPSVSHMVFFVFFPYLHHFLSTPIIYLRVALFFLGFSFRRYHPSSFFCAPPFFFFPSSFFPFPYVLSSHIRIVISPVVAVGAHAMAVPQPAGPCHERVISGRKEKYVMECAICRGSNEIQ